MVYVLAGWTLVIWAARIRNIVADDGSAAALVVPAVLVALAVWTLVDRRRAVLLAAATVAVWVVRLPFVLAHDHSGGFKAVHAALALLSIGLAVMAGREVTRSQRGLASRRRRPSARA